MNGLFARGRTSCVHGIAWLRGRTGSESINPNPNHYCGDAWTLMRHRGICLISSGEPATQYTGGYYWSTLRAYSGGLYVCM